MHVWLQDKTKFWMLRKHSLPANGDTKIFLRRLQAHIEDLNQTQLLKSRSDRLWDPPSLLCNGYRVFPGGKAAGA